MILPNITEGEYYKIHEYDKLHDGTIVLFPDPPDCDVRRLVVLAREEVLHIRKFKVDRHT